MKTKRFSSDGGDCGLAVSAPIYAPIYASLPSPLPLPIPTPIPAAVSDPTFAVEAAAVVFDMDGLLLDTEVLALAATQTAATQLGIELPHAVCHLMIGVPLDGSRRLLCERYGLDFPVDRLFAAAARELEAQVEAGMLRVKPGVVALLDVLDRSGIPKAVATSSARAKAMRHLSAAGLANRFSTIVTRDDVLRGKPHPDLFLSASHQLGIAPAACLALEDSYNGVRAAHAAGMPVVMVPDLLPPTVEMRRLCVGVAADLHEVAAVLGKSGRLSAALR